MPGATGQAAAAADSLRLMPGADEMRWVDSGREGDEVMVI